MSKFTTPFIERPTPCSACERTSLQKYFRSRLFVPAETESDGHAVAYKWIEDVEVKAHPPYYFVKQCPHCRFADIEEDYVNPSNAPNTRRIVKALPELEQRQLLLIQLLGQTTNIEEPDFYTALNQHLLCVRLQSVVEDPSLVDSYKIARLYLRIAWLYREQKAENRLEDDDKPYYKFPSYTFLREKILALWPEAPVTEEGAIRLSLPFFEKAISTDPRLGDTNSYFGMLRLMLDLMVRLGEINDALRLIRGIYKSGSDTRAKLQKILKDKEADPADVRKARGHLERVNDSLTKTGELRRELIDRVMECDRALADKVVQQNPDADVEEMERAFKDAGLAPEIFVRLREKGGPLEDIGKKRGWF
jgi:hypothetical protein